MKQQVLIIITGPSLTGKSKLVSRLKEEGCMPLVTTTTRPPREGEIDGVHYNFISKDAFKSKLKENGFIEHIEIEAQVDPESKIRKEGNFYGLSKDEAYKAMKLDRPAVVVCEPEGTAKVHAFGVEQGWNVSRVFLNNPLPVLAERFLERFREDGNATSANYAKRLLHMMGPERVQWVEPALNGTAKYEHVFDEFGAHNEKDVMRAVLDNASRPAAKKKAKNGL